MRLRLPIGLQNSLRRRSAKSLMGIGAASAVLLLLVGGGVYAALVLRPNSNTSSTPWYNMAWQYRIRLTVDHTKVGEALTDFPVYVDLADMPASFFSSVSSNGGDIRITTDDGTTELAREVAVIDTTAKTGELYFKAPSLSSTTDTSFYIYYGNPTAVTYAATDTYGTHNVWTNGFTAVYHMNNDPGGTAPQVIDSTGNGNGTANGSMTAANLVSGKVGKALSFDGTNDYIALAGTMPTGPATLEAWEKTSSTAEMGIIGKLSYWSDAYGYGLYAQNNSIKALAFNSYNGLGPLATPAVDSNWHYGAFTVDGWGAGTTGDLYLDGALSATGSGPASYYSSYAYTIGSGHVSGRFFSGSLDEIRVSSVDRSAGWIATSYGNENAPASFYAVGSPESSPGTSKINVASGEQGLVGEWKLDGNAKDSTPYAHDGTVSGAVLTTGPWGKPNSAYSFDGNDSVTITNPLNQAASDEVWTVNAWVNLSASGPSANQYLVYGMNNGLFANYSTSNRTLMYINGSYYEYGTANLRDGKWHMLTFVFRNADMLKKVYVDGVDDSSYGPQTTPPSGLGATFQIGRSFVGSISDMRIYNRVLSQQDITNLYGSHNSQIQLGGSGAADSVSLGKGLIGYWPFNGSPKDISLYQNNGTVHSASLVADREGRANSAYSFDGSTSYISVPDISSYHLTSNGTATMSAWVNPGGTWASQDYGRAGILSKGYTNYELQEYGVYKDFGWGVPLGGTGVLLDNQWQLLTVTYDQGTVKAYLNGGLVGTLTGQASMVDNGNELDIGKSQVTFGYFRGSIDDVRLYNRALSANEVQALYSTYY